MPKRNYGFEKRQKELTRQRKQEEKRQRRHVHGAQGAEVVLHQLPVRLGVEEVDLDSLRDSYLRQALKGVDVADLDATDLEFLADETRLSVDAVEEILEANVAQT